MARVFLSYDRDDTERARPIALALEKAGHYVWWDLHIRGGEQFSKKIDEALQAAEAVVVLWSNYSIESPWVRDEAAAGRDSGRLIPVSLDDAKPPLGFRQYQTIDLSGWKGRGKPAQLQSLFADVEAMARSDPGGPDPVAPPLPSPVISPKRAVPSRRVAILVALIAVITVAVGFLTWQLVRGRDTVPLVAVAAADSSGRSQDLARDLLVKLGNLQSAGIGNVRLADGRSRGEADLAIEVSSGSTPSEANLMVRTRDQTMLWTAQFKPAGAKPTDLNQRLAYSAAQALRCAIEGLNTGRKQLGRELLKLYLTGCALHPNEILDVQSQASTFAEITRKAPWFEHGWARLLTAEKGILSFHTGQKREELSSTLRKHVAQARQVKPHMAEAYLAEAAVLPPQQFADAMRLADLAVAHNPESVEALVNRADLLSNLGRWGDAVNDAFRAVEMDPISQGTRIAHIMLLAHSGQLDTAFLELEEAEQLWPNSLNLINARGSLYWLYGGPKESLRIFEENFANVDPQWNHVIRTSFLADSEPTQTNQDQALAAVRAIMPRDPSAISVLVRELAQFGRHDELIRTIRQSRSPDMIGAINGVIFFPAFRHFWRDPQSMAAVGHLGQIEYWRTTNKWPDFCTEPSFPYDCKAVVAKLYR